MSIIDLLLASLTGNQFVDRVKLIVMEKSVRESRDSMIARVRKRAFYIFTLIQIIGLGVLWVVKQTTVAIAFPLFLLLLIPVRLKILPRWIEEVHLSLLLRVLCLQFLAIFSAQEHTACACTVGFERCFGIFDAFCLFEALQFGSRFKIKLKPDLSSEPALNLLKTGFLREKTCRK
jgi:hypothetical protein